MGVFRCRSVDLRDPSPHPRAETSAICGDLALLNPSRVFLNLQHVASPNASPHERVLQAIGDTTERKAGRTSSSIFELKLAWLREIGFLGADGRWKWRELALLAGAKPFE